ncbi:MAG: VapC toxin family PIN domain ribonuclease [Nitrospirae bacterium]|nr:VapC toxin family PIN domain ribonuclease [Nitrospirota bacterium]
MVIVDSSVWIAHLRTGDVGLDELLDEDRVTCHPFIVGELACGNLANRAEILSLLRSLPTAASVEHEELMWFIENYGLMGIGLGFVDMHILASAMLAMTPVWSLDRRMGEVAGELGLGYRNDE